MGNGGKRPNAGRKKSNIEKTPVTVRVLPEVAELIKNAPNQGEFITDAVKQFVAQQDSI